MSSQSCDRLTFSGYNPTHPAQYNTRTTFPQTVGIFLLFFVLFATLYLKTFHSSTQNKRPTHTHEVKGQQGLEPNPIPGWAYSCPVPGFFFLQGGPIHPTSTSLLGTFKPNNRSHFAARSLLHFFSYHLPSFILRHIY